MCGHVCRHAALPLCWIAPACVVVASAYAFLQRRRAAASPAAVDFAAMAAEWPMAVMAPARAPPRVMTPPRAVRESQKPDGWWVRGSTPTTLLCFSTSYNLQN